MAAAADLATETALAIRSVLIVDDHPLYCDALASTMQSIFHTRRIRTADTLESAMQHLKSRYSPDLVLLDLNLPDVAGLSGFLKIKKKAPEVPVIVISAVSGDGVVEQVMAAGAAGFIPKETGRESFRAALLQVCDGKTYVPPGYEDCRDSQRVDSSSEDIARRISELSHQQNRILALICKGKPNKLIAYEMQLAEATVKAHITALLRRLGARNRTQAAMMVREVSIRQNLQ
ncbi:MAG: response regulator transcription factor [Rhodobacteraceae bacterium]|nr:response regulator transcription factor [Paracoccaceae bacterium]